MTSYLISEFLNSYVISKLKIMQDGKKIWIRVMCASIIGMTVDNFLFLFLAYFKDMPMSEMIQFTGRSYFIGLFFEWLAIPLIKIISDKLKTVENTDVFDINTNFNPFRILDLDYSSNSNKTDISGNQTHKS